MKTLISLLGAEIVMKDGVWHSNDFKGIFTSFRIFAAASLLHLHPDAMVLLQGGLADENQPSLASVMQQELLALGISKERVILEERSEKTFQQLIELQQFALQEYFSNIKILSNDWHLPRVQAMVVSLSELTALNALSPEYVGAEDVLMTEDPKEWHSPIAEARLQPALQNVIAGEKRGIEQMRNGTYRFS